MHVLARAVGSEDSKGGEYRLCLLQMAMQMHDAKSKSTSHLSAPCFRFLRVV